MPLAMRLAARLARALTLGSFMAAGCVSLASAEPLDASADAALDASAEAAADADASPAAALAADAGADEDLAARRDALRALGQGELPQGTDIETLVGVDPTDERAVEAKKRALAAELASQRAHRGDAGATLAVEVAEAELAFLSKPAADRTAAVERQRERRRLEREQAAAEAERKRALEEAAAAQGALMRALARERARAGEIRGEQAVRRHDIAERRQSWAEIERESTRKREELSAAAASVPPATSRADVLYDRIVEELTRARRDLHAALDRPERDEAAPRFVPEPSVLESTDPASAEGRAKLEELKEELDTEADALDADAQRLADERLTAAVDRVAQLNATRLDALGRVTAAKRDRVLGFGEEGRAQLMREVDHVRLMATWMWRTREDAARAALRKMASAGFIGMLVGRLVLLGLLVGLARSIASKRAAWADSLRALVKRTVRRPVFARPLLALVSAVRTVLPEGLFLAVVLTLPRIFPTLEEGAPRVLYVLLRTFAVYRFVIAAAHRTIDWLGARPLAGAGNTKSARVLRSVRLAFGYAMFVTFFLVLSEAILGRGYLYSVAARFAWLGSIPIAATLIRWWRDDIADAYLRWRPTGGLAERVKKTRRRWFGFFVVIAASLFVFAGFAVRSARRFVLSFDQSRSALAYLFRKRLERRADEELAPPSISALPSEVREAFDERPVTDEALLIDHFPGLDRFEEAIARWREDAVVGSMLVVGKTGYGKTTWLDRATGRAGDLPVVRLSPRDRFVDRAALAAYLAEALGHPGLDLPALGAAVADGPRRLVVVDDAQSFLLRGVRSLDAWQGFVELVEASGARAFWLVAIARYPYEYLRWARSGTDGFRERVDLPAWTEQQIADLLAKRTAATGFTPVYEDLLVDRQGPDAEAELVSTGQEYSRLLWDHAQGSPRVALHAWARSLVPDEGKRLRVRLFRRPEEHLLDRLDELSKFVLASVLWHESLSAGEASRSLRYAPAACDSALRAFVEQGILVADGPRFRVTVEWWTSVNRYLRRKHLIEI